MHVDIDIPADALHALHFDLPVPVPMPMPSPCFSFSSRILSRPRFDCCSLLRSSTSISSTRNSFPLPLPFPSQCAPPILHKQITYSAHPTLSTPVTFPLPLPLPPPLQQRHATTPTAHPRQPTSPAHPSQKPNQDTRTAAQPPTPAQPTASASAATAKRVVIPAPIPAGTRSRVRDSALVALQPRGDVMMTLILMPTPSPSVTA